MANREKCNDFDFGFGMWQHGITSFRVTSFWLPTLDLNYVFLATNPRLEIRLSQPIFSFFLISASCLPRGDFNFVPPTMPKLLYRVHITTFSISPCLYHLNSIKSSQIETILKMNLLSVTPGSGVSLWPSLLLEVSLDCIFPRQRSG